MSNLQKLKQKYRELGEEIEALETNQRNTSTLSTENT